MAMHIGRDEDINRIMMAVTRVLERREKERLGPLVARETERVGMGAPAVARIREEVRGTTEEKLAMIMADLLEGRRKERRVERLTGEERIFQVKRTRAQWAEFAKRAQVEMGFRREQAQLGRTFIREERVAGQTFQEEQAKKARSRASKAAWAKVAVSLGLGAITGGIGAAAGLFGEGVKGFGKGALLGGLVGPGGVGQLAATQQMLPFWQQILATKGGG